MTTQQYSVPSNYEQEALRFAFYPQTRRSLPNGSEEIPVYPAMAMLGEIGELCEKLLVEPECSPVDIVLELGDVLWYVAAAARAIDMSLYTVIGDDSIKGWPTGDPGQYDAEYWVLVMTSSAGRFAEQIAKKPWRDGTPIDRALGATCLREILTAIANVANDFGFTLTRVAETNIDKLVSRRARGVLKGSGDNR